MFSKVNATKLNIMPHTRLYKLYLVFTEVFNWAQSIFTVWHPKEKSVNQSFNKHILDKMFLIIVVSSCSFMEHKLLGWLETVPVSPIFISVECLTEKISCIIHFLSIKLYGIMLMLRWYVRNGRVCMSEYRWYVRRWYVRIPFQSVDTKKIKVNNK